MWNFSRTSQSLSVLRVFLTRWPWTAAARQSRRPQAFHRINSKRRCRSNARMAVPMSRHGWKSPSASPPGLIACLLDACRDGLTTFGFGTFLHTDTQPERRWFTKAGARAVRFSRWRCGGPPSSSADRLRLRWRTGNSCGVHQRGDKRNHEVQVYTVFFCASTATTWWFGDRAFTPPGMRGGSAMEWIFFCSRPSGRGG